jgi:hypothetical protein
VPKETFSEPLLDHLLGVQQERLRDREAESLGGGRIDHEIEPGSLLDRDIGRLRPAQNFVYMIGGAPEGPGPSARFKCSMQAAQQC